MASRASCGVFCKFNRVGLIPTCPGRVRARYEGLTIATRVAPQTKQNKGHREEDSCNHVGSFGPVHRENGLLNPVRMSTALETSEHGSIEGSRETFVFKEDKRVFIFNQVEPEPLGGSDFNHIFERILQGKTPEESRHSANACPILVLRSLGNPGHAVAWNAVRRGRKRPRSPRMVQGSRLTGWWSFREPGNPSRWVPLQPPHDRPRTGHSTRRRGRGPR